LTHRFPESRAEFVDHVVKSHRNLVREGSEIERGVYGHAKVVANFEPHENPGKSWRRLEKRANTAYLETNDLWKFLPRAKHTEIAPTIA
jgi:hypothetical protein